MKNRLNLILGLALLLSAFVTRPLLCGPTSQDRFGFGLEADGSLGPGVGLSATGKYWFDGIHALDLGLGGGDGWLSVGADFLWHNYKVFKKRDLPLYYGVGGYVNEGNNWNGSGIRGKIGVAWLLPHTPWEFYGEASPAVNVIGGIGFGVGLEVGARVYLF